MMPLAPNITWCAAESDSVPGSTWVSSGLSVSTPIVLIPSDMISSDLAGQVNNHGRTKHRDGCDVVSVGLDGQERAASKARFARIYLWVCERSTYSSGPWQIGLKESAAARLGKDRGVTRTRDAPRGWAL